MSGFVYIWFDRKHCRFYIGSHWGSEDDGYVCSSSWMSRAYKRRPRDFKRRILKRVNDRANILLEEQRYLDLIKPNEIRVRYYNLTTNVQGNWAHDPNKRLTVGQKISKARTGQKCAKRGPRTEEVKEKIRQKLKGRSWPVGSRKKRKTGFKKGPYKKRSRDNGKRGQLHSRSN